MTALAADREGFAAFMLRMRTRGIGARDLISAFESVPRPAFVGAGDARVAWSDRMLPIDCGEAIEGVDLQATILAALELDDGCRVLEVGTGSGYTAAVTGRLAARVLTLERYRTLVAGARQRIEQLGLQNVTVRHADGAAGLMAEGPFDRIVVWSAFDSLPRNFVDQLSSGGIMVAAIGPADGEQVVARLTKVGSRFERADIARARLQPLLPGLPQRL